MPKVRGFQGHEMKKVIITRQRNCGKVMFSQVFVYSQRGGRVGISGPRSRLGVGISGTRSLRGVGICGTRSLPEGDKYTWGIGIPRG